MAKSWTAKSFIQERESHSRFMVACGAG
jgi:hypothetical protein